MAMTKNLILGAMAAAGLVALAAILDLALGFPFAGYSKVADIMFLIAAAITLYLGWETFRENR